MESEAYKLLPLPVHGFCFASLLPILRNPVFSGLPTYFRSMWIVELLLKFLSQGSKESFCLIHG